MNRFFLRESASRARLKEAAAARENRREIVKALSWGQVSRRDLIKYGLFTGAGMIAPLRGLSPFATSAYAAGGSDVPTGLAPSPLGGVKAFTQPMLRFDVLQGDTDHTGETGNTHTVLAADYSAVKKKFFKNTTDTTSDDTSYSAFHDVDGSGSILANDFSEVKKRFFQNLAPPPAGGAAALAGSSITSDLFGGTRIL